MRMIELYECIYILRDYMEKISHLLLLYLLNELFFFVCKVVPEKRSW